MVKYERMDVFFVRVSDVPLRDGMNCKSDRPTDITNTVARPKRMLLITTAGL